MDKNAKRVIITGGSRGIGAACVERFIHAGSAVAFIYNRSGDDARELAERTGAYAVQGDVADPDSAARAMAQAADRLGGVDILVNNAGIAQFRLFDEITEDDWQTMLATNLGGVYRCTRAVVPDMIRRKSGSIVNISSMWGISGASCESHYSAAKAGVIGLTKSLARELGPSGIRVNCVAPGAINTRMNDALDSATRDMLCSDTPLGRLGTPAEVAACVFFLASEEAAFVTGQVLSCDGGYIV